MKDIPSRIKELKEKKNAVILAHYYVPSEIQAVADFVGDSYYLAKKAKGTNADIVVFAGVGFMGESAKVICPDKKVLMPDLTADCPMARMASAENIKRLRAEYSDLAVVCYINSTLELKCLSDVCVTSANAVKIVKNLPNKNILFIPDGNLGAYVKEQVTDKNIILNDGCCPVHAAVTRDDVISAKAKHPGALVLTHPECKAEVREFSDFLGSTSEIIDFVKESDSNEFIISTEDGVGYALASENPQKHFYFVKDCFSCPDMKLNTLEKVLSVLEEETNEVHVDAESARRASIPLDRMLEFAR